MFWTGLGFLVVVIVFGTCLLLSVVLNAWLGPRFYETHAWAAGLALTIGGLSASIVGNFIPRRTDRVVMDVQTGELLTINRSHHTFLFIPMTWAGIVIAALGIGVAIFDVVR